MSFGFFGIQFGFGLQNANMSAIYQYLGASESQIPLLWLAAPVTGLIVQPIIGHYSDRTWTRLGRRRPYFLGGAILASCALLAMPSASSLWMAAGLLWILDASINISMEPFRAFVGDLLPPTQRQLGFSMQSLLIGLGAVLSSFLPWLLTRLGIGAGASAGPIPQSVHIAFYFGAVVFLGSVLYTIVTTPEYPPDPSAPQPVHAGESGVVAIFRGIAEMPHAMRRLAVVQFFTWFGLFCMWIYFSPAVARGIFGGEPGSPAYQRGAEWSGVCFAFYNGVAFVAALGLVGLARSGIPTRTLYRIGLVCAGIGLVSVGVVRSPWLLLLSMTGVGVGWATILSMPYAMLADAIPAARMGFYMGVFNFFIVIPQILAATVLGPVVGAFFGGHALPAVVMGGISLFLAAASLSWVPAYAARPLSGDLRGLA
ncbi:MAG TPA: MFS transporter [Opitutaceae bacterium]|jgi:maltose/moltooligosaccharide transporter